MNIHELIKVPIYALKYVCFSKDETWKQLRDIGRTRQWESVYCNNIKWASWHLKSPTNRLSVRQFVKGHNKEKTTTNLLSFCEGNSWWIPLKSSNDHYGDVIMGTIAFQITSLTIVYSNVYSDADQSSASLAFVRGIHRRPVNSPHKCPVTRKMVLFDNVIMMRNAFHVTTSSCQLINFVRNTCSERYPNKQSIGYRVLMWVGLKIFRSRFEVKQYVRIIKPSTRRGNPGLVTEGHLL